MLFNQSETKAALQLVQMATATDVQAFTAWFLVLPRSREKAINYARR
jgi:hypothetical protein